MKRLAFGLAGVFGLTSSAFAADFPISKSSNQPNAYIWTGLYAGVNAGYGRGRLDTDFLAGGAVAASDHIGFDGFLGGAQVGANAQHGAFVLGVEADIQLTAQKGTRNYVLPGPVAASLKLEVPWFATIRGRAGIAQGSSLFYVTGGLFYAEGKTTATIAGVSASASDSELGWVVGAGVESAVGPQWTWKFEYLFADTGNRNDPLGGGLTLRTRTTDHIVRLGLNYRFGS